MFNPILLATTSTRNTFIKKTGPITYNIDLYMIICVECAESIHQELYKLLSPSSV